MRTLLSVILLAAAATVLPTRAVGQVAEELEEGSRVRVWLTSQSRALEGAAENQRVRGTLLSVSPDSLTVSIHPDAAPVTLAWPAVSRLERSRGVPSRAQSALVRALQMAAFGAVEFALLEEYKGGFGSTGRALLVGAGSGAGIGIIWGALYPKERWAGVQLDRP